MTEDNTVNTSVPARPDVKRDESPVESPVAIPAASPRIRELITRLAEVGADCEHLLAEFWAEPERRAPLIEEAPEHPGHRRVTFVYRAGDQVDGVWLRTPCAWFEKGDGALQRIPGTDIWFAGWVVSQSLRASYGFIVRKVGEQIDLEEAEEATDPLAENQQVVDWGPEQEAFSILELPTAEPLPWLARHDTAGGTWHEHEYVSETLGNTRKVWMHLPEGGCDEHGELPLLVVFDGLPWHSAPAVVRKLSDAGRIPPMAVLLISSVTDRGLERITELPCNDAFTEAIATELLPWAAREFPITADPARVVATGRSFGGLAALWLALRHPNLAGNVVAQSTSCWFHPSEHDRIGHIVDLPGAPKRGTDLAWGELPAMLAPGQHTPRIIEAFAESERLPLRLWQNVGRHEDNPEEGGGIGMLLGNRWLHDVLVAKGYETEYLEFTGGHDDAWWRGLLGEGLIWAMGKEGEGA